MFNENGACNCLQQYHATDCPEIEPGKPENVSAAIGEYAAVLQRIYDERTAGDFTFTGVLAQFLFEAKEFVGE